MANQPNDNVARKDYAENVYAQNHEEESGVFDFRSLWYLILKYKFFLLASALGCLALAHLYLKYNTVDVYSTYEKILIKNQERKSYYSSTIASTLSDMGRRNFSNGFENELELLKTKTLNMKVVRNLKLYTSYVKEGNFKDHEVYYKNSPYLVDYDNSRIDSLKSNISVVMTDNDHGIHVDINWNDGGTPYVINKDLTFFPSIIHAQIGDIYISDNPKYKGASRKIDGKMFATIRPISGVAGGFTGALSVKPSSQETTIAILSLNDNLPERARDYLEHLAKVYNDEADFDYTQEAARTASFIDDRLGLISHELNMSESDLERFKRQAGIVDFPSDVQQSIAQKATYESQLIENETQISLLDALSEYVTDKDNYLKTIPTNVGFNDGSISAAIASYNQGVQERNHLLETATTNSPQVQSMTENLSLQYNNIVASLNSARQQLAIKKRDLEKQYSRFDAQTKDVPKTQRELGDVSRQQEVKAGLYLMLLQKREENAIALASSAYKGKVIEEPITNYNPVSPVKRNYYLIALAIGLLIPFIYHFVRELFRYRIENREDLEKVTDLPVIGVIPYVKALSQGERSVVVQENRNSVMMEVYRTIRSNLPFVLDPGKNVILFTSSTSGEGKTSVASNLAATIAFVGKKVIVVGLDIRKPRLAGLFDLLDTELGISNFLSHDSNDVEFIDSLIQKSGVNENLDVLPAGPIPPNPSEILERPNLGKCIEYLKKKYDYVIIDSAPVGLVSDTLSVARYADLTLYVVRADFTLKADAELFNQLSYDKRLPNVNLIFNAVKTDQNGSYGRYGHYGSYGSYGKYGKYGKSYGYGKGYGYGGKGYGGGYGYGGYGYSNYYNYLMMAQLMNAQANSSNTTTTTELDKDRYYRGIMNGPSAPSRQPLFRVTFSVSK